MDGLRSPTLDALAERLLTFGEHHRQIAVRSTGPFTRDDVHALMAWRPPYLERGQVYEPTVLGDIDNRTAIAREEISGPVVTVIPRAAIEAIAMANDTDCGLHGGVFTVDPSRGLEVA